MEISENEAREEYVRRIQNEILRRRAKTRLSDFIRYLHPDYMMGWVHQEICDTLDNFIADVKARKAPRLIICMPPRSGKSEIVSRNFPAFAFGVNPDLQIIACSYSADLTSRFNRDVQRLIDNEKYYSVFPDTTLNAQNVATSPKGKFIRTSDLFEIVNHKGAYRSTGVGGGITGQGAECVTADSVILTAEGNKSVKRIHAGDTVIGYNINTGKLEPCLVEAVRVKNATEIYRLCSNSGRSLKVTSNHPIFSNGEYIQANILAKGAPVLCAVRMSHSGSSRGSSWDLRAEYITENQKISVDESVVVYDLQVAKCHNFFANGFLVHNCLIIDDPFKDRAEADSATIREKVWDWYTSTAYTRLSDGGGVIVMATRWHQDDIIGRLVRNAEDGSGDKFTVINYPAIAEHDEPHRKQGEALHPERFSLERLLSIQKTIGSRDWAALYQQHPVPDGGAVFKLDTFRRWNNTNLPPKFDRLIGSWDLTFKDSKSSDYVVGQIWGRKGIDYYLLDQVRGQWDFTKTLEMFIQLAQKWPSVNRWLIEDKANGSAIISMLKKHIHGVTAITPTESKLERAYSVTPMIECGNVYIPESVPWLPAYEDELLSFPAGAHDDQVDCTTQALNWCRTHHKAQVSAQNLLALRRGSGFFVKRG